MGTRILFGALAAMLASGCGGVEPTSATALHEDAPTAPNADNDGAAPAQFSRPSREPVSPDNIITLPIGKFVSWSFNEQPKPVGYRMGNMTVVVRGSAVPPGGPKPISFENITQQITIQAPGRPDYLYEDNLMVSSGTDQRFGYGKFDDRGTLYVLRQFYTGGSQCCGVIDLFILHPGRAEHVELGEWSNFDVPDARDYDGDGLVDFVVADDRFRGVFTFPIHSRTPPMILNVVDGQVRDVSMKPGLRPVFARAARSLRLRCTRAKHRDAQDGACPAYVAAAARAGSFRTAWADMLETYRHRNRLLNIYGRPDDIENERYAEELRDFLQEHGYAS